MKTLVQKYLEEPINFGGEIVARGTAIRLMREDGIPERCIDRWLQGYDSSQRMRKSLRREAGQLNEEI